MNSGNPFYRFDEETLVGKASKGDLDAFNQLVLAYQDLAYNHARTLVHDTAQAEDAAQEGFIKAFQGLSAFRGGSFRGWLLKIITNAAYDMLRKSHRHPTQPLFPADEDGEEFESPFWLADPTASVEATVEGNHETKRLYRLLDELPDDYRSVLTLVDLNDFNYAEAARALQIPIGTVKSRLARARLQMQKKLAGAFEYSRNARVCFGGAAC